MPRLLALVILYLVCCGCSQTVSDPTQPSCLGNLISQDITEQRNPHRLLGLYQFIFPEDHLSCEVVPVRAVDFHLNALKFLEMTPCTNCVTINNLTPIGNGIIDLDVTIHHPFDQPLIYSAFDVRGIIMFNGSLKSLLGYLTYYTYPEIYPGYISWARRGDWELLNTDGYSYYWSPEFNPNSQWPITQYLPGKFSSGTPTANINGYKEFYTDEERHLFRPGYAVTRTYRIQTQPGPMVVGYAIDACWEPPLVTPVTDPLTDFPLGANAPEPYRFDVVVNDGQPVTEPDQLCGDESGAIRLYIDQWNGINVTKSHSNAYYEIPGVLKEMNGVHDYYNGSNDELLKECDEGCGDNDNCYCNIEFCFQNTGYPSGWYRLVTLTYWGSGGDYGDHAVDITDFYYDPG